MPSFRDIKRSARRDLHQRMQVPALYIVPGSADEPLPVTVRLHYDFRALGTVKGTSFSFAELQDVVPRILFMRDELAAPARDAIVSIETGEAYRIDNVHPADDITVTAEVVRMKASDTVGLPVPEAS